MKIVKQVTSEEREAILKGFMDSHDFSAMIDVFSKSYCYYVELYPDDFARILINSSNEQKQLRQSEYPTLERVIEGAAIDSGFFCREHVERGLSGLTVKKYFDEFKQNKSTIQPFFVVDRDEFPEMSQEGSFYVRDGMHHLVAFGLATRMQSKYFPIMGYYGTSKQIKLSGN